MKGNNKKKMCLTAIAAAVCTVLCVVAVLCPGTAASASTHVMGYEDKLFDNTKVHSIDIVMDDWDGFIAQCENEEYSSCSVIIDGERIDNVAIRAKGNTSLSSVRSMGSRRYSFKVEFDHFDKELTYHGLDKLCLNNLIQDNTMMKDFLVYTMMGEFGVASPLCSYANITVNGSEWGLYLAVEGVEDSFLTRNYGDKTGELYKPDSTGFGGGRGNGRDFSMNDFDFSGIMQQWTEGTAGSDSDKKSEGDTSKSGRSNGSNGGSGLDNSQSGNNGGRGGFGNGNNGGWGGFGGNNDVKLKYIDDDPESYPNIFDNAKTKISKKDQKRLIAALKNLSEYTDLDEAIEMDEVLRYFVVHNFVVNGDSYTGSMVHNYYLHEKAGLLAMIPWDYNLAYGTFMGGNADSAVNSSIDSPVSGGSVDDRPMVGWIFSDDKYTKMYHEVFNEFLSEWFDNGRLAKLIADTNELIRPYITEDPTRFCTVDQYDAGVAAITQFVELRAEAVRRQLNGDMTKVDTGSLNISAMGTMGWGGNFGGGNFGGGNFDRGNIGGGNFDWGNIGGGAFNWGDFGEGAFDRGNIGGGNFDWGNIGGGAFNWGDFGRGSGESDDDSSAGSNIPGGNFGGGNFDWGNIGGGAFNWGDFGRGSGSGESDNDSSAGSNIPGGNFGGGNFDWGNIGGGAFNWGDFGRGSGSGESDDDSSAGSNIPGGFTMPGGSGSSGNGSSNIPGGFTVPGGSGSSGNGGSNMPRNFTRPEQSDTDA